MLSRAQVAAQMWEGAWYMALMIVTIVVNSSSHSHFIQTLCSVPDSTAFTSFNPHQEKQKSLEIASFTNEEAETQKAKEFVRGQKSTSRPGARSGDRAGELGNAHTIHRQ